MALAEYTLQSQKGIANSFDTGAKKPLMDMTKLPFLNVQADDEWAGLFTTTEGFTGMRETGEHETPEVNTLGDGYSVTITKKRFTNAYEITSSDIERMKDSTTMVDKFLMRKRDHALMDAQYYFSEQLMNFFLYGDVTTKYAAPDTKALFATDHAWATGGTFSNKGTAALSDSSIQAAMKAMGIVADSTGKLMRVRPNAIVVYENSTAAKTAIQTFAMGISPTTVGDINIYKGAMAIYELPMLDVTKAEDWFLFDTRMPDENPLYAGIGQFPHFTAPKVQNNEAIRQNIEGFWKQGIVNMPYMAYGSFV